MPSHGVYCSATPGVVAQQPRDDLVELVGRERRRVGEAAGHREHARRRAGEDRGQLVAAAPRACGEPALARSQTSTRKPARSPRRGRARRRARRSSSARAASAAARVRREDRALGAPDRLGGLERGRDPRGRRDHEAVVVAEHDVARARRRRRRRRPARRSGARDDGRARARGSVPRAKTGSPSARSPRDVAAEAVGDDPREPAAAAPRWRTARRTPRACRRWWRSPARRPARPRRAR